MNNGLRNDINRLAKVAPSEVEPPAYLSVRGSKRLVLDFNDVQFVAVLPKEPSFRVKALGAAAKRARGLGMHVSGSVKDAATDTLNRLREDVMAAQDLVDTLELAERPHRVVPNA